MLALLGFVLLGWAAIWWVTAMPGPRHGGPLMEVTQAERDLADRLREHVEVLAAGPRATSDKEAQLRAVEYIERQLRAAAYAPRRQRIRPDGFGLPNVEVEIPGTQPNLPIVVVGAHYDSVPHSPGADDNASAVAVLLELAQALEGRSLARGLRFVFFSEEETGFGGSRFHAADLRAHDVQVSAMLSLEMLGFYSDEEESQRYPISLLGWLYPSRGDFVSVLGNLRSRALTRLCVETMRRAVALPCEGIAAPDALRDVFRSDNQSYWREGYAAVMVTDTSNFRNPHYHKPSDLPATLDYVRMARVLRGLLAVVERLGAIPTE